MAGMRRGGSVVVGLRECEPESGRCPIHHGRGERQSLNVHPLPVHAIEAKPKTDELLVESVDDSFGSDGIAACVALKLRSFGRTVPLEQFEPVCGIPMGVDIDHAARPCRWRRVIVSSSGTLCHRLILRCGCLRSIGRESARLRWPSDGTDPARRVQTGCNFVRCKRPIPDSYGSNDEAALVDDERRGVLWVQTATIQR